MSGCSISFVLSNSTFENLPVSRKIGLISGIFMAVAGSLILRNVNYIGHFGNVVGGIGLSSGVLIVCIASVKCRRAVLPIEGRQKRSSIAEDSPRAPKIARPQPFVTPLPEGLPLPPEELMNSFRNLKEGDQIWIGQERRKVRIGQQLGNGGSKRAMEISEDEVLMLAQPKIGYAAWRRMVNEEVQTSDRIRQLNVFALESRKVELFLDEDSDQSVTAYICPSFDSLAKKGMYVVDQKNPKSSCWNGSAGRSYFKAYEDRYSLESWLPIVTPLIREIFTLVKYNCPVLGGDTLNLIVIDNVPHYFGFDFSNGYLCNHLYGKREDDITSEVGQHLHFALTRVFWEQYDCDKEQKNCGLSKRYYALADEFRDQCPRLLKELGLL